MSPAPRLQPMLAGGNGVPVDRVNVQFEPKLDGQRAIAVVEDGVLTLLNRRGGDMARTYPELVGMAAGVAPHDVVLDGEIVAFDDENRTSFQRLQRRMHVVRPGSRLLAEVPAVFYAFDVLWLDGDLLIDRPLEKRRQLLESLTFKGPCWDTVPIFDAAPDDLLAACRHLGLEGFMAKRCDSTYQPGRRSLAWSKVKCGRRREFVVGGWSQGSGSRSGTIGSLALGCYDISAVDAEDQDRPQRLFYVGQAGSGLTEATIGQLTKLFAQIEEPTPPFVNPPRLALHYVRPVLVVEVAYSEVTEGGTLRQPSIKGLRTDLVADEVTVDEELVDRFGLSEP